LTGAERQEQLSRELKTFRHHLEKLAPSIEYGKQLCPHRAWACLYDNDFIGKDFLLRRLVEVGCSSCKWRESHTETFDALLFISPQDKRESATDTKVSTFINYSFDVRSSNLHLSGYCVYRG